MEQLDDRLLLSATDLINHLECPHLTTLDLGVATGDFVLDATRSDTAALVARKGDEHEAAYLAGLRAAGRDVVEITAESGLDGLRRAAERTHEAMRTGADVI